MSVDVVCVGEALFDFFAESEGDLAQAGRFVRMLGGAPANVSVGLARRGVAVGLVAAVGRDAFGRAIRSELEREGVAVDYVAVVPARTGLAFVGRDGAGEPEFLFYRGDTADTALCSEHVDAAASLLRGAKVLHLCGNAFATQGSARALWHAVEIAEAAGVALSFDLNLRLHMWRREADAVALARELIPRAMLVKASVDEATAICGEGEGMAAARAILALGAKLVLVTQGAQGAFYASAAGAGHIPAAAAQVMDTTGAGDAFCASLLAELLGVSAPRSWPELAPAALERALGSACWAAARVCESLGATAGLPTLASFASLDRGAGEGDSRVGGGAKGTPMVDQKDLLRIRELARELGVDVAIELVELFLQDTPGQIAVMREAHRQGQDESLHRAAHSLKGSCSNLGLRGVATLAADLEKKMRTEGREGADGMIERLEGHYHALVPLLSALRNELAASEA